MAVKKNVFHELKCILTPKEFTERSKALAAAHVEKSRVESALADFKAHNKEQMTRIENEISSLARVIDSESEYRTVECEQTPDFASGTMETYRMDTGERITIRDLTEDEKQARLPLGKPTKKREEPEDET